MSAHAYHSAGHCMLGARALTFQQAEDLRDDIADDFQSAKFAARRGSGGWVSAEMIELSRQEHSLRCAIEACRIYRKGFGHDDPHTADHNIGAER